MEKLVIIFGTIVLSGAAVSACAWFVVGIVSLFKWLYDYKWHKKKNI